MIALPNKSDQNQSLLSLLKKKISLLFKIRPVIILIIVHILILKYNYCNDVFINIKESLIYVI